MRLHQRWAALVVFAMVVPGTEASAQSRDASVRAMGTVTAEIAMVPRTVDPVQTSNISGFANSGETTWLAKGPGEYGIDALSWHEVGDKPCAFTVRSKSLSAGSASGSSERMNICGAGFSLPSNPIYNPSANGDARTVVFDGNPRHYLRGIAVCTNNDNNHRVKGIRIYPASVGTDGTVTNLNSNESASRTNCATWHAPVYCPNGQIASGIAVKHTDNEVTGIGLRCRRVAMQLP